MTQKDLLKNLSYLSKTIQPQKEWKDDLKYRLTGQLAPLDIPCRAGFFNVFNFQKISFPVLRLQPAAVVFVLMAFIGMNSLGLAFAKNSLPGSFLYNYKKINEKITLTLIQSPERKISLKSSFANQRLKEFSQLAKRGEREKTFVSVNNFQENLNEISISFSQIEKQSKAEDLMKLAFILDAQTAEYEEILNQTKKESNLSEETKEKVETALDKSEQTGTEALKVVIREYEGKGMEIYEEKLALRLKDKIERTENSLIDLGDLPIQDDKFAEEVKKVLAEAKDYLAEGSFSMALEKIEESKKIADGSEIDTGSFTGVQDDSESVQDDRESVQDDSVGEEIAEESIEEDARDMGSFTDVQDDRESVQDHSKNVQDDKKEEKPQKQEGDFQTDMIKENKRQEGFFGGLIKSKK